MAHQWFEDIITVAPPGAAPGSHSHSGFLLAVPKTQLGKGRPSSSPGFTTRSLQWANNEKADSQEMDSALRAPCACPHGDQAQSLAPRRGTCLLRGPLVSGEQQANSRMDTRISTSVPTLDGGFLWGSPTIKASFHLSARVDSLAAARSLTEKWNIPCHSGHASIEGRCPHGRCK